jgi:hypothetical protein
LGGSAEAPGARVMRLQVDYDAWLAQTAAAAVADGATTLRAVVERCAGADPLTVRTALGPLLRLGASFDTLDAPRSDDGAVEERLPPPHPLDFEWRFSRRGAEVLLNVIDKLNATDVTFMGATTVAIAAGRQPWKGRLVAIDQSRALIDSVRQLSLPIELVLADVCRSESNGVLVDAVVIDPPWYFEQTLAFFVAAAHMCRIGGHVIAVLPGAGTRPGVTREKARLFEWCEANGLELVRSEPQSVPYETPLFEINALRAAGIAGDLRSWRRGDLWILRRLGPLVAAHNPASYVQDNWEECMLGQMRVRFRVPGNRSGDTRLQTLVEGDILPSVSRRDARRENVQVWTRGNRVFRCDDPDTLLAATRARVHGANEIEAAEHAVGRSLSTVEALTLRASCGHLADLSDTEHNEHNGVTQGKLRSEGVTA